MITLKANSINYCNSGSCNRISVITKNIIVVTFDEDPDNCKTISFMSYDDIGRFKVNLEYNERYHNVIDFLECL